jgi:hypothetical protein
MSFGGSTPAVTPVNVAAQNANAAQAAAKAEEEERKKLRQERGVAATMLTSASGTNMQNIGGKKSLLGE